LEPLVLVFAKTPLMGKVKNRLAAELGEEKTLWVYKQLLLKTEAVLKQSLCKVVVFYTGGSPEDFGNCFQDFSKKNQIGSDLGERMSAAFQWGFAQGYSKVIALGTDLWELNQGTLDGALHALDEADAVLGPAKDGGYYLLGLKEFYPELFLNKQWSGPKVLNDTLQDLGSKRIALLEEKSDIDFYKDLVLHSDLLGRMNAFFDERKN
jgi:rSAM/selenodomain-associated transferase 1